MNKKGLFFFFFFLNEYLYFFKRILSLSILNIIFVEIDL
jgi:hypothetical protein